MQYWKSSMKSAPSRAIAIAFTRSAMRRSRDRSIVEVMSSASVARPSCVRVVRGAPSERLFMFGCSMPVRIAGNGVPGYTRPTRLGSGSSRRVRDTSHAQLAAARASTARSRSTPGREGKQGRAMHFEEILSALRALVSPQPVVATIILMVGIHAASWMVVFDRIGYPRRRVWLLLVPPLTFLLPLYVVFARWPKERTTRFPQRPRNHWSKPRQVQQQRVLPRQPVVARAMEDTLYHPRGVHLAADGLPRVRIPLTSPGPAQGPQPYWPEQQGLWPAERDSDPRFLSR